jgi:hypothetical protein
MYLALTGARLKGYDLVYVFTTSKLAERPSVVTDYLHVVLIADVPVLRRIMCRHPRPKFWRKSSRVPRMKTTSATPSPS